MTSIKVIIIIIGGRGGGRMSKDGYPLIDGREVRETHARSMDVESASDQRGGSITYNVNELKHRVRKFVVRRYMNGCLF
jgi:hypothetical protein